jgi:hypothetical protein
MDPITLSLIAAGVSAGGSMLGGLFGSNSAAQAQKAQQAAIAKAQGLTQQGTSAAVSGIQGQQPYWDQGYAAQKGAIAGAGGYLQDAGAGYQPYAEGGGHSWDTYLNGTGANGGQAQNDYYTGLANNSGFTAAQDYGLNALQQSAAARGGLNSGGMAKSLMDYSTRGLQDFANTNLGQLYQGAQTGYNATGQQGYYKNAMANLSTYGGNVAQGYYNQSASVPYATGQTQQQGYGQQADYAIGSGNAAAQGAVNQGNAWTNALSGAGNALGSYFGYGMGRSVSGNSLPQGYGSWNPTVSRA